jgi:hypothetical protein
MIMSFWKHSSHSKTKKIVEECALVSLKLLYGFIEISMTKLFNIQ